MNFRSLMALVTLAALQFGCAASSEPGPVPAQPMASALLTGLGQAYQIEDWVVTPLALVEDSRCPSGVQCIQAGTVRLQVKVRSGRREEIVPVGLDSPVALGGAWLHLLDACPYPRSGQIRSGDYRFILALAPGPLFEGLRIRCRS